MNRHQERHRGEMNSSQSSSTARPSLRERIRHAPIVLCQLGAAVGALIAASTSWGAYFGDGSYLLPIAGAAVVGGIAGGAVLGFRRPRGVALSVSLIAFVLYLIYVLYPQSTTYGLPGPSAIAAVGDGVLHSLARVMTMSTPADVEGDLLVFPASVAFVGAVTAAILIRRSAVLAPLLPPLVVFVIAQLLNAGAQDFQWAATLGFLTCVLILMLIRAGATSVDEASASVDSSGIASAAAGQDTPGRPGWRARFGHAVIGLPIVVGIALLAIVGADAVPVANSAARFDIRDARDRPMDIDDRLNPLVDVRRQVIESAHDPVSTVRMDPVEAASIDRLRVAALDTYDGVQWTSKAQFYRTGSTLQAGARLNDPMRISMDVELHEGILPPYLPATGRPTEVQADQVGFDKQSGLLITGVRPVGGFRYRVTTEMSRPTADLSRALPAKGSEFAGLHQLPAITDDVVQQGLSALAAQLAAGHTEPHAKLVELANYLRTFEYAVDAPPGHSYAALARLLPDAEASIDKHVTEEQAVSAFVLMARSLGFPTRVAVGYRLTAPPDGAGVYQVMMGDAYAWAEVAFLGAGWVAFDPTAPRDGGRADPPKQPADPGQEPPLQSGGGGGTGGTREVIGELDDGFPTLALLGVVMPLGLLLVFVGAVVLTKRLRRSRRRSVGSTSDRILGAWHESANQLQEMGLRIPASSTPSEVGHHAATTLGHGAGVPLSILAPMVSAALYAPDQPDEDAVVAAWDLEAELRTILQSRRHVLIRFASFVDPRSLLRPAGSARYRNGPRYLAWFISRGSV